MAAFAYLLLPVTGTYAYFRGRNARVRFHALQAIALGVIWPLALYAGALISARFAQVVFLAGAVAWLTLMGGAFLGKDLLLPLLGRRLQRAAVGAPWAR